MKQFKESNHSEGLLARPQKIQKNVVGDVATDRLSGDVIESEINSGINAASRFFVCHCCKALVRARRAARAFPCVLKRHVVAPEKERENR